MFCFLLSIWNLRCGNIYLQFPLSSNIIYGLILFFCSRTWVAIGSITPRDCGSLPSYEHKVGKCIVWDQPWPLFIIFLVVSICSIGRGRQEGAIISLVIAAYLAFQHFSRIGTLQKSFDRGSIVATLAIISITAVSGLLLFWVYCKIINSYQPYLPYELIWRGWKPKNSHDLRTFHSHVWYTCEGLGKLDSAIK